MIKQVGECIKKTGFFLYQTVCYVQFFALFSAPSPPIINFFFNGEWNPQTLSYFIPNHHRWHAKWKLSRNVHTLRTRFCHVLASIRMLSRCLVTTISASEIRRKFYQECVVVGWALFLCCSWCKLLGSASCIPSDVAVLAPIEWSGNLFQGSWWIGNLKI